MQRRRRRDRPKQVVKRDFWEIAFEDVGPKPENEQPEVDFAGPVKSALRGVPGAEILAS